MAADTSPFGHDEPDDEGVDPDAFPDRIGDPPPHGRPEDAHKRVRDPASTWLNIDLEHFAGIYGDAPLTIEHGTLRTILMAMMGVDPSAEAAFDARLKHAVAQGFIPDERPETPVSPGGRRRRRRYLLVDALEIALAFQLQRALVDPAAAAAFVVANREQLNPCWRKAAAGRTGQGTVEIEVDGFAAIGGEGRGRGSSRMGALALAGERGRDPGAEAAPTLTIDLRALHGRMTRAMSTLDRAARALRRAFPGSPQSDRHQAAKGETSNEP